MIGFVLTAISCVCAAFCTALLRHWIRRALEYQRRWRQALALVEAQAVYVQAVEDASEFGPSYAPEDAAIARRHVEQLQAAMEADAARTAERRDPTYVPWPTGSG